MTSAQGAIFFDGLCVACSTEINHYRKLKGSESFRFIDITDASFKAEDYGIDPQKAHRVMHVQDTQGQMHEGVDAFRAIWKELPKYQFLYRLSERRAVRALLEIGYKGFVIIRPYLPRRKADCSESPYCEIKK
jgi:predicted DCC family thiol-disulfide oxidoreductase YuxK